MTDAPLHIALAMHKAAQAAGDLRAMLNGFSKPNTRKLRACQKQLLDAAQEVGKILEVAHD